MRGSSSGDRGAGWTEGEGRRRRRSRALLLCSRGSDTLQGEDGCQRFKDTLLTLFGNRNTFFKTKSSQLSAMDPDNNMCHDKHHIDSNKSPMISAIMFALGIFGNVAALVILEIQRRRSARSNDTRRRSLFHVLITSLVLTDLAGTCLVTPLVQLSYARNTTMVGMSPVTQSVCKYFAVSMTFFS
ncbi:hypothetical protein L3Q82_009882 [Scortum barcoo]|uniref:Uncharacterized protein n=1 Tax=Scortum barcoo TaxID=214431 RepID=A0ACB8WDZ3_9TELE|nr:hypothetical protein L3Q82_009882 [Scortum barcoo]